MFWSRYVALCDKIGKAPNVVAAEVGVKSSGTVTGWKNGAKPRDTVLQRLSVYFGVSVEELTGEKKRKPVSTPGDELEEAIIIGRDGKKIKRTYTKDQMDAIRKVIDVMPFVNDEEIFDGSLDDF
jgi:hypothetical protein